MQSNSVKNAPSKFPLRLMPSIRKGAEALSKKEGVSLNQFINVAIAEKIAHAEYNEWLGSRSKPTAESLARALEVLNRATGNVPEPGDELPEGYKPATR